MEFSTVVMSIIGIGGLSFIAYYLTSKGTEGINIREAVHGLTQKLGQEKVNKIEEKQTVVKVEIENKEKLATESKEKIKEIQKKASEEIAEVLKQDNIAKIQDQIDEDWDEI